MLFLFLQISHVTSLGIVDFKLLEIDSNIVEIVWCGHKQDSIIVLTELTSIYKSNDHGLTWIQLNNSFPNTGNPKLEKDNKEVRQIL